MRAGRPRLALGQHGKIATQRVDDSRFRASAQIRTWDDEMHRVTATADTAAVAQALLKERLAERLRTAELFVWRSLTPDDPFHELVICWLDDLWSFSETSETTYDQCERILRAHLKPAFGHLAIGDLTRERIAERLAILHAKSEDTAAIAYAVLELLLDFAVGEGAIESNPLNAIPHEQEHEFPRDLDYHREVVRGRIQHRRKERRQDAGRAGRSC